MGMVICQGMEGNSVPDLEAAARHLEIAKTSLAETVRALNTDGAAPLAALAQSLGEMAEQFRKGMLLAGLRVPLIDAKNAARVLGRCSSPKKLDALARARIVRNTNRRLEKESKMARRRVAPNSIGLV
jgi:hypothetical protein